MSRERQCSLQSKIPLEINPSPTKITSFFSLIIRGIMLTSLSFSFLKFLFIFGCAESSLLQGLSLVAVCGLLIVVASLVAELRL